MASRLSEAAQLANRCRKAGWRVESNGRNSGWKVWTLQGFPYVIHSTYSDRNGVEAATRNLENLGLSADEERKKMGRLNETRTRAAYEKQAAEEKGKELAAKAALTKAAGPYMVEPERVPLDWFIAEHPLPWHRWVFITPAIAQHILTHHNGDNRPIGPATVEYYRDIILAGLWRLTHQGLALDTRGLCQDGQHRLQAIVEVGKLDPDFEGVPFAVTVGMPIENFAVIDEGKLRSARQLFAKGGEKGEKNAGVLQTLVRLVHYLNDENARRAMRLRLPNAVIVEEFSADADNFRDSADFGKKHGRKIYCNEGSLAAAHYILRRDHKGDTEYVDAFFEGFVSGMFPGSRVSLDDYDPRKVFRVRMLEIKTATGARRRELSRNNLRQVGMIIHTWNNCVQGRSPRNLQFGDMQPIPAPVLCKPGVGVRPEAFRDYTGYAE